MVRHYIRKKEKAYTDLDLQKAIDDVKNNGMSSSQAALVYGIPRTTINTRLQCVHDTVGRPTVFSADFEKRMAENLHIMEKHGFPLSRKEASVLISEYVRRNGMTTPFKDDIPGKDWFYLFQKRNGLSIKKPQHVEISRRKACDPFVIYEYFDLLEKVVEELISKTNLNKYTILTKHPYATILLREKSSERKVFRLLEPQAVLAGTTLLSF